MGGPRFLLLVLLIGLVCLSGCAHNTGDLPVVPAAGTTLEADMAIPMVSQQPWLKTLPPASRVDDSDIPIKSTLVANPLIITGDSYLAAAGEANRPGDHSPAGISLVPGGEDDLAWAMYDAQIFGDDRPVSLSFETMEISLVPGGEDDLDSIYWVGLSNYTQNAWEFLGPFTESTEVVLNSEAVSDRYVTPGLDPLMHYVVVVDSSQVEPSETNPEGLAAVEVIVSSIPNLGVDDPKYQETAPPYTDLNGLGLGAAAGHSPSALQESQHVILNWEHIADPYAPDCEATYVRVFRRCQDEGQMQAIGTVDSLRMEYVDPLDNSDPLDTVTPGARFQYWIRSGNNGGLTRFSAPWAVTVPLYPPSNVQASDGEYSDQIVVTWDAAEGAADYEVYRDGGLEPVASVADVTAWADTSVDDFNPHAYRLKSVNQYATSSSFSAADAGYQSTDPIAVLIVGSGEETGTVPHEVHFDASGSYDPDDAGPPGTGITEYEWDWNGDGVYASTGGNALQTRTYLFEGTYTVTLRVTDDELETGTDYVTVNVEALVETWQFETILTESAVGEELSMPRLALDAAVNPAVIFIHSDSTGFEHVESMRFGGGIWYDDFTFSDQGTICDIGFVEPAALLVTCFSEDLPGSLIQLGHEDITGWDIEDVPGTGLHVSHAFATSNAGSIGVAFEDDDVSGRSLNYAYFDGSWSSDVIDDTFDFISYLTPNITTAFSPVTGYPVIAYTVFPEANLRVAWFDGIDWTVDMVANAGETGFYPAVAVSNTGEFGVAFMDWTAKRLMFAWSAGGGVWHVDLVDEAGSPGDHCSSIVYDLAGNPAISYHESQNGYLRFARYDGADWNKETLDENSAGYWSDLVNMPDGQFAMVYHRASGTDTSELVYARFGFSLH